LQRALLPAPSVLVYVASPTCAGARRRRRLHLVLVR
jgi:hypothetical protein